MSDKIRMEIVTPAAMLASEDVDEITAPGVEGEFGVLPGHCHMLSSLRIGELSYKTGDAVKYLAVGGGYAEVGPDRVTILAETAEYADTIDIERAKAALGRAEEELKGLLTDDERYAGTEAALEKARTRLEVAGKGS